MKNLTKKHKEYKELEQYIYSVIPVDDGFSEEDFLRIKKNAESKRS